MTANRVSKVCARCAMHRRFRWATARIQFCGHAIDSVCEPCAELLEASGSHVWKRVGTIELGEAIVEVTEP